MKKLYSLILLAFASAFSAAAQVVPEDGKQYVIKNVKSGLYIALATGSDSNGGAANSTAASLQAVGTAFTFTGNTTSFTLQAEDGKWLGMNGGWNVGTTSSSNWSLIGESNSYGIARYGSTTTGLGLDNLTAGSGIYTDKSPNGNNNRWVFEVYEAQGETHTVTASVDGGEEVTMIGTDELGYSAAVEVSTGNHTVIVNYDGEPTSLTFTTIDYKLDVRAYTEGYVNIFFKDGVITVEGNSVPTELYALGYDNVWNPAEPSATLISKFDEGRYWDLTFTCEEEVSLAFGTAKAETMDDFNLTRFSAPEADYAFSTEVNPESPVYATLTIGGENNFKAQAGTWTIRVKINHKDKDIVASVVSYEGLIAEGIQTANVNAKAACFDLQGRRAAAVRGLYIQNGVKVIR